jgi:glutathione S-transferase
MVDLVLHHYPASPFAEKIRTLLGAKNLAWKSVIIPMIMPKPDVIALTGGYRKTPILQIGADVYCDTALIARVLDQRAPKPALEPAECAAGTQALARWADSALFQIAVVLRFLPVPGQAPFLGSSEAMKAFAEDRAAFRKGATTRRIPPDEAIASLAVFVRELEAQLSDGRAFAFGATPTLADFSVYHPLWFLQSTPLLDRMLAECGAVKGWIARMRAIGHGESAEIGSEEALAIARGSRPLEPQGESDHPELRPGDRVEVVPTDYGRDPSAGELVACTADHVAVRRVDPRAGEVVVHFPRMNYEVRRPG